LIEISPKDPDGVITLGLTIAIGIVLTIVYVRKKKGIWNIIKEDSNFPEKAIVVIPLIVVSFVALWLTIRVVGLYTIRRYIETENYTYTAFDVLEILSYVLAIKLCLTLIQSRELKQIIEAAIQSVLIGVITTIPRIGAMGKEAFMGGATTQFAFLMIAMAVILIALVFVRKHFVEREGKRTEST